MRIVLATSNLHKVKEIEEILQRMGCDVELTAHAFDVKEDGKTYAENALKKVKKGYEESGGIPCIADDSGLEIDALPGMLGLHSARFMQGKSYSERNNKILELMQRVPEERRSARFICVAVYFDGNAHFFKGVVEGVISNRVRGNKGFGYDPIFIPRGYDQTMAQLGERVKNEISHRARAFKQLAMYLKSL